MTIAKHYPDIKICLFDFDGTVIDSMGAFADLAGSIIEREYGVPFNQARNSYLETSGIPFFQQLEVLFPAREKNPMLSSEFEERKQESFFSESFSEDTKQAMSGLKDRGFLIGISSNNFQHLLDEFVKRDGIPFDYLLGYRDGFAKGRDHFTYIETELNCQSHEILFVGDSLKDGEKAAEHGTQFIGKLGTFTREQFTERFPTIDCVDKLRDLLEIL